MDRRLLSFLLTLALVAAYGAPVRSHAQAGEDGPVARNASSLGGAPAVSEGKTARRTEARPRSTLPLALAVAGPLAQLLVEGPRPLELRSAPDPVASHAPNARLTRGPPVFAV